MSENKIKKFFNIAKNRSRKLEKYFSVYEELFEEYKNKKITFVEIGVSNGGSLDIWKKYFSKDSRIIGIDLNVKNLKKKKNKYLLVINLILNFGLIFLGK